MFVMALVKWNTKLVIILMGKYESKAKFVFIAMEVANSNALTVPEQNIKVALIVMEPAKTTELNKQ